MAKTIKQQTGWKRPHKKTICQDYHALMSVHEYDFDLDNQEFVNYFIERTGIKLGSEERPELARWLLISPMAQAWLRTSKDYKYLESGEAVPLGEEREGAIAINKILKGRIQDCWELFNSLSQ
ncbi:hypothetical protein LCGC14_1995900 [marine sediment metagenome]|uniref:Uncharacterized protein n=1 Tax=marine sediment metagenome TaxID=412755 RepID=A0A0F9F4K0_9ZZZZ